MPHEQMFRTVNLFAVVRTRRPLRHGSVDLYPALTLVDQVENIRRRLEPFGAVLNSILFAAAGEFAIAPR